MYVSQQMEIVFDNRSKKTKTGNCLMAISGSLYGGAKRDRTADLHTASVALSQLSYGPVNNGNAADQVARCGREYSHEGMLVSTLPSTPVMSH